jgi:hypothetical protein
MSNSLSIDKTRDFSRFVVALHRRHLAWRALEAGATGLLVACVALLPLLVYRLWKQEPSSDLVVFALMIGCATGVVVGWLHRPTQLASALVADQQLDLDELLSTAWLIRDAASADRLCVLEAADQAVRNRNRPPVRLRSMTARAWGGTLLVGILVTVLCLLNPSRPTGQSATAATAGIANNSVAMAEADRPLLNLADVGAGPSAHPNAEDIAASRLGQGDRGDHSNPTNASQANPAANQRDVEHTGEGRGGGAGKTGADASPPPSDHSATGRGSESGRGATSAGSGAASDQPRLPVDGRSAQGQSAGSASAPPAPPWSSNSWPVNVQRAEQAVTSGAIPASYRDLVRGYFQ